MALSETVRTIACSIRPRRNGTPRALLPGRHRPPLRCVRFCELPTLSLAFVIFVAAMLSKLVAAASAHPPGPADALRVGVGMVPRGEVGMVVAQIGLSMGVMAKTVYAASSSSCPFATTLCAAAAELGLSRLRKPDAWAKRCCGWDKITIRCQQNYTERGDRAWGASTALLSGEVQKKVTKYVRYRKRSTTAHGILDGETVREIRGDLFGNTPKRARSTSSPT